MDYLLPDGRVIDLYNITDVSEIRDLGEDEATIGDCTLSFTVRFLNGRSIRVCQNYHYNDWSTIIKELRELRNDILSKWTKCKKN